MRKVLYLIDGSNTSFRAHFAFHDLMLEDIYIGAIYGTVRILTNFMKKFPTGKIIMPFDVCRSTYRLALYPAYKGQREKDISPDAPRVRYSSQLHALYELLSKMGVCVISEESRGIEADDVIAYLCSKFRNGEFSKDYDLALIISSDKDLCALINKEPMINWYDPMSEKLITADNFQDTFDITINQYSDFKALMGDVSDNIPHPSGIGPGTAAKLLREYGSIAKLLAIKHERIFPHKEVLDLAKSLVMLDLHEKTPGYSVWKAIDQKIKVPTKVESDLVETLEGLSFNSILNEWEELGPKISEFASCSL